VTEEPLLCRLCGGPVVVEHERYEVFEWMHWLCFHIVFEHDGDPDEPCGDPSCPRWHVLVYRRELERLGHDPNDVLGRAIDERYGA
jgi:hypothetical protein